MTTYGVMKTRIADEIVRDDLASQMANAIQTALTLWENERFWFNERRFKLPLVAGQQFYPLSALLDIAGAALNAGETLIEVDDIVLMDGTNPYTLDEHTHQSINNSVELPIDATSITTAYRGRPLWWAWYEDQLRFSPIPDVSTYYCIISGLCRLKTLSADNDTNAWMTSGEALIRNQAKLILYRDVTRDEAGAQAAQIALGEALAPLKRRTMARLNTGRIAPWVL